MAPLPHAEIRVVAMTAGQHSRWICQLIVHVSLHFHLGDLHFFWLTLISGAGLFAPRIRQNSQVHIWLEAD